MSGLPVYPILSRAGLRASNRNFATSAAATSRHPALTASVMIDRPRLPQPISPMFSRSLAPRALTAGAPRASAPADATDAVRNVRRVCMGGLREGRNGAIVTEWIGRGKYQPAAQARA